MRSTVHVARELLGKRLVRIWNGQVLSGIIVETEAYCGLIDAASHAYKGQTPRNKAMFGEPGHSYVYFIYGNHHCLNLVAKEKGVEAGGVLLRALIPFEGVEHMQKLRQIDVVSQLTNGPGKIGQALHLNLADNHIDVTKKGALYVIEGTEIPAQDVIATPRIGISKAQDCLWRFTLEKEALTQLHYTLTNQQQ